MNETLERDMNKSLRDLCEVKGLLHYHTVDSRKSNKGFPDWVVIVKWTSRLHFKDYDGYTARAVIYAEFKSQNRPLTVEQAKWIKELRMTDRAYVVRGKFGLDLFLDMINIPHDADTRKHLDYLTREELKKVLH